MDRSFIARAIISSCVRGFGGNINRCSAAPVVGATEDVTPDDDEEAIARSGRLYRT
jgi:hypothetical protein